MSAQGGTLQRRRTIELPIWLPVAVLVVAALAAAIGMRLLSDTGSTRFVTSVTDIERFENSSAAFREQGATLPVYVGISHVAPSLHASTSTGYSGLENPAATYIRESSGYAGLGNPTAVAPAPRRGPIMINGKACMQCK